MATDGDPPAGCILRVRVVNFMCHEHFVFDLCPQVNFVVGLNGSGKSAIFAAIVMCLGGSARSTGRGDAAKDLIRHGAQQATVSVTLFNGGRDAYEPDVYGTEITIERKFGRTGASAGYTLKNDQGKSVGKQGRQEVDRIVEHFNIQVDNPVVLMSQDNARQFIHSSSSKSKYEFFHRATQLSSVQSDLAVAAEKILDVKRQIDIFSKEIPALIDKVDSAQKTYDGTQELKQLEGELLEHKRRLAWAYVHVERTKAEGLLRKRQKAEDRLATEEPKPAQAETRVVECRAALEELNLQMNEHAQRITQQQQRRKQVVDRHRAAQRDLVEAQRRQQTAAGQVSRAERTLQQVRQRHHEALAKTGAIDRSRELAELQERRDQFASAEASLFQARAELQVASSEVDQIQDENRATQQEYDRLSGDVRRYSAQVTQARASSSNRLNVFDQKAPKFYEALAKLPLQRPAIGPILGSVAVKPGWENVFEIATASAADGVVVSCDTDRVAVRKLQSQHQYMPSIYVTRAFDQAYFQRDQIDPRSILALLGSAPPAVVNTLVDFRKLEKPYYFETTAEASKFIFDGDGRVKEGYSKEGHHLTLRGQSHMIQRENAKDLIVTDVTVRIRESESRKRQAEEELQPVHAAKRHAEGRLQEAMRNRERLNKEVQILERTCMQLQQEIQRLEYTTSDFEENAEVMALDEEVRSAEVALQNTRESAAAAAADVAPFEVTARAAEDEMKRASAVDTDMMETVQQRVTEADHALMQAQRNLAEIRALVEQLTQRATEAIEAHEAQAKFVEDSAAKATRVGGVEPAGGIKQNPNVIVVEIQKLERKLERASKDAGITPQQALEDLEAAKEQLQECENKRMRLVKRHEKLDVSHIKRGRLLGKLRQDVRTAVSMRFHTALTLRNCVGTIKFDDATEELQLSVNTDALRAKESGATTDVRQLSGGERSFSTVALLLSLWEFVESPFCGADEFDVFMDDMTRQFALNVLIRGALASNRQFIFLTPNDSSMIEVGPRLKVFRLDPPRP